MGQQQQSSEGRDDAWSATVGARIARAIRDHRTARGMSAQALADRCGQLGWRISRSKIANLEHGDRSNVTLPELLVLAAALAVPPGALLFPGRPDEPTEVLPGVEMSALDALNWFAAAEHTRPPELPRAPEDDEHYLKVGSRYLIARQQAELIADVRDAGPAETRQRTAALRALDDQRDTYQELLPQAFEFLPPLPDDIAAELEALHRRPTGASLIPRSARARRRTTDTEQEHA